MGDAREEKASIFLVKEYRGLQAEKGLLLLNKSLRSKASKVNEIENLYAREITSSYCNYTQQKPKGEKILSEESVSQRDIPIIDEQGSSSSQEMLPAGSGRGSSKDEGSEPPEAHLQKFRETFSVYTPANAKQFFENTLALHLKNDKASLRINGEGWIAYLNCRLSVSANFHLYYNMNERNPKGDRQ